MPAPVLKLEDYLPKKMKIPLQSEIAAFMESKKGWPKEFCQWYADKFWNHYQSQGWVLSNGNKMKDWKACFYNNWQDLRPDVIKKLNESKNVDVSKLSKMEMVDFLDVTLSMYAKGFRPDRASAEKMYQWLRGMNMMNLPPDAVQRARIAAGNRLDHVWMFELKEYLDLMVRHNYTFKQWVK
jgi:hypothetical protein